MLPISEQSTVVAGSDQVSCELKGETVILDLRAGTYYGLNRVAARVFELVHTAQTVASVRDTLLEQFDVAPERCTRELLDLLRQMAELGIVEIKEPVAG